MRRLRNLLFTCYTALSALTSAAGLIRVFGYEGRDVNVSCSYGQGYEDYEKYLCKDNCGWDDVLITTAVTEKNRYSIYDDKKARTATVTISELRASDSGKYYCGVTRSGKDIYKEVSLEIKQDSCCDNVVQIQSHEGGSASFGCSYDSENQNNLKYVCRGKQPSTCLQQALITSDQQQRGQYALTDDKESRKFTVAISNLTQKDSGSYLCGVRRNTGLDVFSAAELEVKDWCCVKSKEMSGIVGQQMTFQCPYPPHHRNNMKFLCKGDHRNNCTDMVTSQSRFTMQYDVSNNLFLVTISDLEAGDAGTYWCGSDRQWSVGNYTKIQLSVVFLQPTSSVISAITVETAETNSTHDSGKHIKDAALYVVFTVSAALLILTLALVFVYKYKCSKGQGAGVATNRNKPEAAGEATGGADIYENQDVVRYSKQRESRQQSPCFQYDDVDDDQPDYENITEDIYCNQTFHKANNR
ncbi:polymeric immunoglobulin receptor-like isoform X2 [Stegastes partitus]|uniref:polymeric immunoglobulin receptor-like isoform X2 n=1 Tax=Stegastes partitus TaxID=144197 RepID=UPI00049794D6|nr:PREDICTED: polymeric immunoglobulin receptor-like isoform X2 [Stegastes partitus]